MSLTYENEFSALLAHLQATLGLESLEKEDQNICTFLSKETFISFINQSGNLIIVSNFAKMRDYANQAKIKKLLLESNVLYNGSNGGAFAVNEDGIISFCFQYPIQVLTNEQFIFILDAFINTIEDFLNKFKQIEEKTDASQEISIEDQLSQQNWQRI